MPGEPDNVQHSSRPREAGGEVPRPAATVILTRDREDGPPEVFLLQRNVQANFGGLYVFPGGKLDEDDGQLESICDGLSDADASVQLSLEQGGLSYWAACIRECFEEAGVLLAVDSSGNMLDLASEQAQKHFADLRHKLNAGDIGMADICQGEGLKLATSRLAYCAHWITPEAEKRRYDTRFFIAATPANQHAVHDGSETVDSYWVSAREALEQMQRGDINMIPPTFKNLQAIADFTSSEDILQAQKQRKPEDIPAITPRLFKSESGELMLELPDGNIPLPSRPGRKP